MKRWALAGGLVVAVAACLGILMSVAGNAKPVDCIVTAANVMMAGFTFLATLAALRSAAASEQVARRATEALARTLRPALGLTMYTEGDGPQRQLIGRLTGADGPAPVDVQATWHLADGTTVTTRAGRLERWRSGLPSGAVTERLGEGVDARDGFVVRVVAEYSDEQRVGRWRHTWRSASEGPGEAHYLADDGAELI